MYNISMQIWVVYNICIMSCVIMTILVSMNVGGMYTIISPIRDKWKDLGLKLGLNSTTLEAISKSHDERTDQCLYSVLTKWLQRRDDVGKKGGVTWNVLIRALKCVEADDSVLTSCVAEANAPNSTVHTRKYAIVILVLACMGIRSRA